MENNKVAKKFLDVLSREFEDLSDAYKNTCLSEYSTSVKEDMEYIKENDDRIKNFNHIIGRIKYFL